MKRLYLKIGVSTGKKSVSKTSRYKRNLYHVGSITRNKNPWKYWYEGIVIMGDRAWHDITTNPYEIYVPLAIVERKPPKPTSRNQPEEFT